MLTHQQRRAMLVIEAESDRTGGVAPTLGELAARLKLRSRTSAHRLVEGLVERGFIRRMAGMERALAVVQPVSRFAFLRFDDQSKTLRPYASPVKAETAQGET